MSLLTNFDYTSPFYYLVTLKVKKGVQPLSILSDEVESGIKMTEITRKMKGVIFWMNQTRWAHQIKIAPFIIMPNHLHLIIRILDSDKRPSLIAIVQMLMGTLSAAYYDALDQPRGEMIFHEQWHDWIVSQSNSLNTFIQYVKENAHRALYRKQHATACYPTQYVSGKFTWTCLGTLSPKDSPVRIPVICSRTIQQGSPLWKKWQRFARRLGPGCVAIGTFMSPCEKMVRAEVLQAGGGIIKLVPQGMNTKSHAAAEDEPLLAAGRLTIMTPFPFEAHTPTVKELYDRCHNTLNPIAQALSRGVKSIPPSR